MLYRCYISSYGLPLPIANYMTSEDHFAYCDGGLVTAARQFVSSQQVQHSGDVCLMCLQQLIVAHAGVPSRNDHVIDKGVQRSHAPASAGSLASSGKQHCRW